MLLLTGLCPACDVRAHRGSGFKGLLLPKNSCFVTDLFNLKRKEGHRALKVVLSTEQSLGSTFW